MTGPPIIEDTGDSSSENQRSEGGSETLEIRIKQLVTTPLLRKKIDNGELEGYD